MDITLLYEFEDYDIFETEKEKFLKGVIEPDKICEQGLKFSEPLYFTVNIQRKGYKFLFDVKVETTVAVNCDRCLELFDFYVKSEFKFLFEYNKEKADYISGHILKLRDMIIGEVYVNIPLKKLCATDCKGLCQNCGANLNKENCNCKFENSDNPFHKIYSLLN
jgi:uncharacterized protein